MDSDGQDAQKWYSEEDVAALIRSLDREEDFHIFAEDVLKTYPYLAESYTKVCPVRCDLATAAQKALDGAYSHDAKLAPLAKDIALMASNCIVYNGVTSAYAETAQKFKQFALEQIDAFVTERNGGRRPSRLRLGTTGSSATHAGSKAAATSATVAKKARADAVEHPVEAAAPSPRELAQLVDSLNRREDGGAFSVDVAEAYPDLREAYQKVCPQPMNLVLMHQRAKEGYYTAAADDTAASDSRSVYGDTLAASLPRLREDVELLVRNCITFNAKVDSWVTLARSFQSFAHRRIDDCVLRHAASLRGTLTGAEYYASLAAPAPHSAAPPADGVAAAASAAAAGASSSRKRERAGAGGKTVSFAPTPTPAAAAMAAVRVVSEVAPHVCPTPLQPALEIPAALRTRLAVEHLRHAQLPLRRVGVTVSRAELFPTVPSCAGQASEETADGGQASQGADGAASPSPPSTLPVTVDASASAAHVLRLLRRSIEAFFSGQRSRADFADAFAFSEKEEQTYVSVLYTIQQLFERVLPHLLLYEREAAEWAEWVALRALQHREQGEATSEAATPVAETVHYLYLIRFLVQWPQLASLCCCSVSSDKSGQGSAQQAERGSLRISRDQLAAMAQVTRITQELLNFVERIDARERARAVEGTERAGQCGDG